jgi:hypothetical protein
MAITLEDLLRRGGKPLEDKKRGSVEWFFRVVRGIRKEKDEKGTPKTRTGYTTKSGELVGQMVMFSYDPKHKDTLPYYDRYPVVVPLSLDSDSMLGLNLHYLPPRVRLAFVRALEELAEETNGVRRLRISYGIVKSAKALAYYAPCIKRYLHGHVRSQIVNIDDREWEQACLLPIARWVGANEQQVWSDSLSGKRPKSRSRVKRDARVKKARTAKGRTTSKS